MTTPDTIAEGAHAMTPEELIGALIDEFETDPNCHAGLAADLIERQRAEIDRLRLALDTIAQYPECGDSQHRHTGPCSVYSYAGFRSVVDIARKAADRQEGTQ